MVKEISDKEMRDLVKSAKGKYRLIEDFTYKDTPEIRERKYIHGLASLDERIYEGKKDSKNLKEASLAFSFLKRQLNNEDILPEEKIEKYKEALEKREYRLTNISNKKHKSSGLEKAITVISLFSVLLGIAISYPAIIGNVVAEDVEGSILSGAALFLLGLLGVFIANKK